MEPTTIGNYTLIRLLGRGSMGAVYEARHNTIARRAAIKILHKESKGRLLVENHGYRRPLLQPAPASPRKP